MPVDAITASNKKATMDGVNGKIVYRAVVPGELDRVSLL